jgi:hypothetical protein
MKKILSFFILITVLTSCTEDIKVNDTAVLQAVKDNSFWEGGNAKAVIGPGNKLTIQGVTLIETMALKMPIPPLTINPKKPSTFVTYSLGTSNVSKATYVLMTDSAEFNYETAIGVGDGQIIVKEYDGTKISGSFRFNAHNTDPASSAQPIVNMQDGVFYRVPILPN